MKQAFIEKGFNPASLAQVELINEILEDYRQQGYTLTLRQLYYQLVARGHIENSDRSYKRTGDLVSNARLAGLIDWQMIEDRGRVEIAPPHWNSPADIVRAAAEGYRIDKWADQPYCVMAMVEKQALEGILIPVCRELDIAFMANKGYSSSSALYELGRRLSWRVRREHKTPLVLYLGDHDPSGIDMTRDVLERLDMFAGRPIEVQRLALNMDQVEEFNPPENPAKITDSRAADYIGKYGESSWELDAVEPAALADLVRDAVAAVRDDDLWDEAVEREERERAVLARFADTYQDEDGQGGAAP